MKSILRPHLDLSMRAHTDKEVEALDLDELFNQCLETDMLQFNDSIGDPASSDDLAHLFEDPSSNGTDPIDTSPIPNWDATSEEMWRKALGNLSKPHAPSPDAQDNFSSIYPQSRGKASLSESSLFPRVLDDLFELSIKASPRLSHSTPSSPKPAAAKPSSKEVSNSDRTLRHAASGGIRKSTHKLTTSPSKMMRPHFRPGYHDNWTARIERTVDTSSLQLPPNTLPTSLQPTIKMEQTENSSGFFDSDPSYGLAMSPLNTCPVDGNSNNDINTSHYELTPLSSPTLNSHSRNNSNAYQYATDSIASAFINNTGALGNGALTALQTPPPSHRLPMASWGPDTPASLDFSFPASPDFAQKPQHHWSSTSQPSSSNTTTYHRTTPSMSHNSTHTATQSLSSLSLTTASVAAGLGISCDSTAFASFGDLSSQGVGSSIAHHNGFPSASSGNDHLTTGFYNSSSFMTPSNGGMTLHQQQQQQLAHRPTPGLPDRSPSPSSPPHPPPRLRRTTTRISGPAHGTARHTPYTPSQRRKSSQSSSTGGGSGSHSGNSSAPAAAVGFVNFTPHDSRKILTGVAPSGSSKTKARREKEAAEKRRKLSQAAVKAVLEAGGDVGRLEEEGLLLLGE